MRWPNRASGHGGSACHGIFRRSNLRSHRIGHSDCRGPTRIMRAATDRIGEYLLGSIVLLDLMGGVALLLWGLHMVHSGIVRAFGAKIRRMLGIVLRNRFKALLAGIGVTALLQSSTATAL